MDYSFQIENGELNYPELSILYRAHYSEMQTRLREEGVEIGNYNPRLSEYFKGFRTYLTNYVVRFKGEAVGYSNVYVTHDMHNGELIAQEDTLYVTPEHRNGIGRKLVKFILDDLRSKGVKRLNVVARTDPRATKLWQRMGFKGVASAMTYIF